MACSYIYRPQTKFREGNVFTPVCDSVHWGGVPVQREVCQEGVSVHGGSLSRGESLSGGGGLCPYSKVG